MSEVISPVLSKALIYLIISLSIKLANCILGLYYFLLRLMYFTVLCFLVTYVTTLSVLLFNHRRRAQCVGSPLHLIVSINTVQREYKVRKYVQFSWVVQKKSTLRSEISVDNFVLA
jgi:hypothetical protein